MVIATNASAPRRINVRRYADRIVAGLDHYRKHDPDLIVCGDCDVPLRLRSSAEIEAAQRMLITLAWDAGYENPLGLTRRQQQALLQLNDRLATFRVELARKEEFSQLPPSAAPVLRPQP